MCCNFLEYFIDFVFKQKIFFSIAIHCFSLSLSLFLLLCIAMTQACLTENHKDLAILMEFMPRNSLWTVLHNDENVLGWPLRRAMLIDTARGMLYLHTRRPQIIHRDLKSHNLLVDEGWKVKVCDFGLSRIIEVRSASCCWLMMLTITIK